MADPRPTRCPLSAAAPAGPAGLVVRVWGVWGPPAVRAADALLQAGDPGDPAARLLLLCHVDLAGLRFFRASIGEGEPLAFAPDTLLFRLKDEWYCAPAVAASARGARADSAAVAGDAAALLGLPFVRADRARVRTSCSVSSVDRSGFCCYAAVKARGNCAG